MIQFPRLFTTEGVDPFTHSDGRDVAWERFRVFIGDANAPLKEATGIEFPAFYSELARNMGWNQYFKQPRDGDRETSLRQVVGRVADAIARNGIDQGVFDTAQGGVFRDELSAILLHQYASFNSPVWYNVGLMEKAQASACFIQSVQDDMGGIMDLAKSEVMLFKGGSGTGSNFSPIRSSREKLSMGGDASGPVSFMKGLDAFAGVIQSGGRTRRAAKMNVLNVDHPDIGAFIDTKRQAEKDKAALELAGARPKTTWDDPNGAMQWVFFQNANHSVRVTDAFMKAVELDGDYFTKYVLTGENCEKKRAREVFADIADAAWWCGDPGLQFDTVTNRWHTCPKAGRIDASNPCSEFLFLNDSACNLASLRLTRFFDDEGRLDIDKFRHVVQIMITAQEILVGASVYPTHAIWQNSLDFRPLGLGYADLGALLMRKGLPYDSEAGRRLAAALTSLMTAIAYRQSAVLAEHLGAFAGYEPNKKDMLRVVGQHRKAAATLLTRCETSDDEHASVLVNQSLNAWDKALELGGQHGFRNAQVSLLAPTGTISFFMDCDTTGCEPALGLVLHKQLAHHATITLVNQSVEHGLRALGYSNGPLSEVLRYVEENGTLEGAPGLKDEHIAVFDTALRQPNGTRTIHHLGHLRMMAAIQPFLSGAISKTVNLPRETTREEIAEVYLKAWSLGLKAIAIYRDGCKKDQPLKVAGVDDAPDGAEAAMPAPPAAPKRRRLPITRSSITHKFTVSGHEGYITVGLYEDGSPGELFVVMSKQGSVVSGLIDAFATSVSLNLQYGAPLPVLVRKFAHMRFEPSGFTGNPEIPIAKSIIDYIFRWLAMRFPEQDAPDQAVPSPTPSTPALAGMEEKYCGECGFTGAMPGCACPGCGTPQACS